MAVNSTPNLIITYACKLLLAALVLYQSAVAQTSSLQSCSAFYPNIGQTELFFQVVGSSVNASGLTLSQNDDPIATEVQQIGGTVEAVSILKATLRDEITDATDIKAAYKPQANIPDNDADITTCTASLLTDSDGDGLSDIADGAPFDADARTTNTAIASTAPLANAPNEADIFYSRNVLVRSLLRDAEFDYIQVSSNRPLKQTFGADNAMTAAAYFGIADADARVFRVDARCQAVLDAARDINLSRVRIHEHCLDVRDDFASEPIGMHRYTWAAVADGYLVASDYRSYEVNVLAEINFLGQSSYLYDIPTTNTTVISAYTSSAPDIQVEVNQLSNRGDDVLQTFATTLINVGNRLEKQATYVLSNWSVGHPLPGETITHWLVGSQQIWQPTSNTLIPRSGGYPEFNNVSYAIGIDNAVDIKVAQADEDALRIHQIILYQLRRSIPEQVPYVVPGILYYAAVYFTTNIPDITRQSASAQPVDDLPEFLRTDSLDVGNQVSVAYHLQDGYRIGNVGTSLLRFLYGENHLMSAEYFSYMLFNVDDTNTTRTISLGWDRIGDLKDVHITRMVSPILPPKHIGFNDNDGDRVSNDLDLWADDATQLQVAIGPTTSSVNKLEVNTDNPLFVSGPGLIMAIGKGGDDSADYSVADITYSGLSAETKALLGLSDTDATIQSLVTFGVRDVHYAINNEGQMVGGSAYAIFPIESPSVGEVLYPSLYDMEAQHWRRFPRDSTTDDADTWYAIEHPRDGGDCPSDIQRYRDEHRSVGDFGMGFTAGVRNCLMLVISDGSPYDNGSRDGRIVALSGISTTLANTPPQITAIDDFGLLQLDEAYTLPVKIRDNNGDDIRISIAFGNDSVVSTTLTALDISGDTAMENTVYFPITPGNLGRTLVTLSASDGMSTSTEIFEITVVANTPPTIDGIEARQTINIYRDAPLVLRFRVNDANVGSEENEDIRVTIMQSGSGIQTDLSGNLSDGYILVLSDATSSGQITISISDADGETTESVLEFNLSPVVPFIRSRFTAANQLYGCIQCDPFSDGTVHIRFAPDAPILSRQNGKDFIEFKTQLRRINGTNIPRYVTVAFTSINYDGSLLNCSSESTPMGLFESKNYDVQTSQPLNDVFSYVLINRNGLNIPNLNRVSALGSDWEDFMAMKCEITGDQTSEARIAIYGSQGAIFQINEYISPGNSVPRGAFVLADNDLRGFGLDGKTYPQDYARYGDGRGVRVKFSKDITTQLTTQHFVVHLVNGNGDVPDVEQVIHTSGSRYANILTSEAVPRAVIRLVSTSTSIVKDVNGNSLANGNFVAALEYDVAAPRVTTITKISFGDGVSTWHIGFSAPIAINTVRAENFCITNKDGICAESGLATTPSVISAALVSSTTISIVVASKRKNVHSLEFRRNTVLGEDFRIVEDYQKVLRNSIITENRSGVECAAFYPNIGQTELFFRVAKYALDTQGLMLMQDGNQLTAEVEQVGNIIDEVFVLKATLSDEITSASNIEATYTASDVMDTAVCVAELDRDDDGDGLPDIADGAPFDASVRTTNTVVSSTAPLANAPAEADVFYSRDVIIRNLLRDKRFDFIEVQSNRPIRQIFAANSAMTAAEYFGITDHDARVFRVDERCQAVLDAARGVNLTKVEIHRHCLDVSDNLESEPIGTHRYTWAVVNDGYLVASNYRSYEVNVLPEINFGSQSSYLYNEPATTTVVILSYTDSPSDIPLEVSHLSNIGSDELQTFPVTLTADGSGSEKRASYVLADWNIGHPIAGETITYWLTGSPQIWQPMRNVLMPKSGGYPEFSNTDYAIGINNAVDIRVIHVAETIIKINDILLYDVSDPMMPQVSSMVSGRAYYMVVDLATNISSIAEQVFVAPQLIDGYTITTPSMVLVNQIAATGDLDNSGYFPVIALRVNDTSTTRVLNVGWDNIGDLSDIKATYVVTPNLPTRYAEADGDGDRIPNSLDLEPTDATELQIAIGADVGGVNRLKTNTRKPLFVSDAGMIMAITKGNDDSSDYSAADIAYAGLSTETKALLGLNDADVSIQSLLTFGIKDVDYAISRGGQPLGGVAYTVFPTESPLVGEALYLNAYNTESQRWERLLRDTLTDYVDTWYAIEHPDDGSNCPTNVQRYRNEHRSDGRLGMGFTAGSRNCIMLVISDGGPYDESSRDGRIMALGGISTTLVNTPPQITAIDDFQLLQSNQAYSLPVRISDYDDGDIKISITFSDGRVLATSSTEINISGNARTESVINFHLRPVGLGRTLVILNASDGVSTSTETFAVAVVANTAPVIEGLEARQSETIFRGVPLILRFRVSDLDFDSVENENIQAEISKSSDRISVDLQGNSSGGYILVLSTAYGRGTEQITISFSDAGGAIIKSVLELNLLSSVGFIKSRFVTPFQVYGCTECDPFSDGVVHTRIVPGTPAISTEDGKDFIKFRVQMRRINGSDMPRYIRTASLWLNYDDSVLRCANENTPVDLFAGKDYATDPDERGNNIFAFSRMSNNGAMISNPDLYSTLDSDWKDFVMMKCEITGSQANEAEIGVYGSVGPEFYMIEYIPPDISVNRRAFILADNDLRGLRLDGRTYPRDYARYGDGQGVRVEFSKGIATQLTTKHFVVRFVNNSAEPPNVDRVIHTSGSRYANVLISRPVKRAVMRLVSTGTTVIEDVDGGLLADGNFVAALEYDAQAPQVTTVTKVSSADGVSMWEIGFSAPINENTARAENLCVTDENGICAGAELVSTPSVISTSLISNTTLSVAVSEIGSKPSRVHSLEFRRNAIVGEDFRIVEDYQKVLRDVVITEDRYKLECGGFYPNIGQTELYFRVIRDAVEPQRLTLMQNGSPLAAEIQQIGNTVQEVSILKAILDDEITDGANIEAVYTVSDDVDRATCIAELYKDSDGDGLADISDNAPFDASVRTTNTEVASTAPLAEPPAETDFFYHRSVVIRSLLGETDFGYIAVQSNRPVRQTLSTDSAMTAAAYFGIGDAKARIFRVDERCQAVLDAAREMNLTKVKIREHCVDVSDNLAGEPSGMRRYTWAAVEDEHLVASAYRSYEVNVVPEINFWGQSSYLYAKPTTSTVIISADSDDTADIQIEVNRLSDTGSDVLQTLAVILTGDDNGSDKQATYALADQNIGHPSVGETITHWLVASSQIWQATSDALIPQNGGYPELDDIDYSIGADNAIAVKLAPADETITRINRIMLYDVVDPTLPRVSSMISGREYYLIADLTTNITDIASQVALASGLIDGYTIRTPSSAVIDQISSNDDFDSAGYFPVIALEVDDTSTTRTINVGWNRLGNLANIQATCVVTPSSPARYAEADGDGDLVPDSLDLRPMDATELQVAIGSEVGGANRLRTNTKKPLFISDVGLIMAIGEGNNDSADYSPANIVYDNLSLGTKTLLDFDDTDTALHSVTTFGVSDVDYTIGSGGRLAGGVTYTVFPMESSVVGETLYLGKYNQYARRWERLDGNAIAGYVDTWYAIEHPSDVRDCPVDVQQYRNAYRYDDMRSMGFIAHTRNCIMLIISDGGPYDASPLDGRVLALNGISSMPFTFDRIFPSRPTIRVIAENDGRAVISARDASHITYSMRFEVFSGNAAQGLGDASSYSLLRILDDGTSAVMAGVASIMPITGRPNTVIVSYDNVRLNETELRETSGFTLARNGAGLSGADSLEPIRYSSGEVITPGMQLDLNVSAIAHTAPLIDEIDDFKLIPTNKAYPLAVTITDNIGDSLSVSIESDNTELMSTTPAFIEIADKGNTTNTVVFSLIPIAAGNVALTVLASDGTTTSTQAFAVEIIENIPPVIEGIETRSRDIYAQVSYVLDFRVHDRNLGVARNEDVDVQINADTSDLENSISVEGNLNDGYRLSLIRVFSSGNVTISATDSTGAKAEVILTLRQRYADFIRSRLFGPPTQPDVGVEAACIFCDPTEDGVSRMRFAPDSVRLLKENGESFIEFSIEAKHSEPNRFYHIIFAGFVFKYNAMAFGDHLNNPFLALPNNIVQDIGGQCTYRSELPNISEDNGYAPFFRSFSNDVFSSRLSSKYFIIDMNDPQQIAAEFLVSMGADWKKMFTIKCKVLEGQTDKEAGFALHTNGGFGIIDYTKPPNIAQRSLLPLVDNDILGFRLDGKTYVRDYARYGDGRGVRVEFSNGIATQLTTRHFVVRFNEGNADAPTVRRVIHSSGSRYANILISEPVEGAVMRLVSSGTTVVEDIEGGSLADESFVAALEYDANAPRAMTITRVSLVDGISTWDIGFSAPIRAATVRAENLCITNNDDGVCAMSEPTTNSAIVSAAMSSATTMTVVVNEIGIRTLSGRSLEFRRNSILGEDSRVVEDYQQSLRNKVAITDNVPPTITVVAGNHGRTMFVEERSTYIMYDINFMVYASEQVVGLTDPNSYQLLLMPTDGTPMPITATPEVTPLPGHQNAVMVSYTGIRLATTIAEEGGGFTLGRASPEAMNDLSGNNPAGLFDSSSNIDPLDAIGVRDETAMAVVRPLVYLSDLTVSPGQLMPSFSSATTFYRVIVAEETTNIKVIPTSSDNDTTTITLVIGDSRIVYQANTDIPLNEAGRQGTIIEIKVESSDGIDSNTYTIEVIRRLPGIRLRVKVFLEGPLQ